MQSFSPSFFLFVAMRSPVFYFRFFDSIIQKTINDERPKSISSERSFFSLAFRTTGKHESFNVVSRDTLC